MKTFPPLLIGLALALANATGEDGSLTLAEGLAKHQRGSEQLSLDQDELSADVQELIEQQTNEQVIQLLEKVEEMMAEVTEALDGADTGGSTIAAETHIIELIFEAAKKKQQSSSSSGGEQSQDSMGAMLEMMRRMMGQGSPGESQQGQQGQQAGEQGGQGQDGQSNAPNSPQDGQSGDGAGGDRRVPKSAGVAGAELPEEFRKAIDAYNQQAPE